MAVTTDETNRPLVGIFFIVFGMSCITVNDLLVKLLSDRYALHQIVLIRSLFAIGFSLMMVHFEGGWSILRTHLPFRHALRASMIVFCNIFFFMAIAAMPIGEATAIFFVAPLMISLLSIPMLGERVGPRRLAAVIIGFAGVLVMMRPGGGSAGILTALLPVGAALLYALFQLMTRQLGGMAKASAMAVYVQCMFLVVSLAIGLVIGDGRYADSFDNASLVFIFRPWVVPAMDDLWLFGALGILNAIIAYALSQAYRSAAAATVAPFEYVALPLATLWGFLIWHDIPDGRAWLGMALILGAGLYVLARERQKQA